MISISEERYRQAEIREMHLKDNFWKKYEDLVRETVLPYQWRILNDQEPMRLQAMQCVISGLPQESKKGNFTEKSFRTAILRNGSKLHHTSWQTMRMLNSGPLLRKLWILLKKHSRKTDIWTPILRADGRTWNGQICMNAMKLLYGAYDGSGSSYMRLQEKGASLISCAAARTILVNVLARKREKEKVIQGIRRLNLPW